MLSRKSVMHFNKFNKYFRLRRMYVEAFFVRYDKNENPVVLGENLADLCNGGLVDL